MAEPALSSEILQPAESIDQPRRLRALGRIIPWPHQPQRHDNRNGSDSRLRVKAEIRTKQPAGHSRVEEQRYDAEVFSSDPTLQGVLQALAQVFGDMDEFVTPRAAGESFTMDIRLRL